MLAARILVWEADERYVQVRIQRAYSYALHAWEFGAWGYGSDGTYGRQSPDWPMPGVDPFGPLAWTVSLGAPSEELGVDSGSARFCPFCGAARVPGGRFCGECGGRFADVPPVSGIVSTLRNVVRSKEGTGSVLAAMAEDGADLTSFTPEARNVLSDLIARDFEAPQVSYIDVDQPVPSTINLRSAQVFQSIVASGDAMSGHDLALARRFLEEVPIGTGYWGVLKALLKRGPLPGAEEAFGVALARLNACLPGQPGSPSPDIENMNVLWRLSPAPSRGTLTYMRRRTRRELANLGSTSPDTYALVAASLLLNVHEPLTGRSFGPAYVLRGDRALHASSRRVDTTSEWTSRSDPYPVIWNTRLGVVAKIFDRVSGCPEVFAWAYMILDDQGQAPRLTPSKIGLALGGRYRPLWRQACAMLSQAPEVLSELNETAWTTLMVESGDEPFAFLVDYLSGPADYSTRCRGMTAAARALVRGAGSRERDLALALLYIRSYVSWSDAQSRSGNWWVSRPYEATHAADVRALSLVLGDRGALGSDPYWPALMSAVPLRTLLRLFLDFAAAPESVVNMLIEAIVSKPNHEVDPANVVATALRTQGSAGRALVWRFIEARGGLAMSAWFLRRALEQDGVDRQQVLDFLDEAVIRLPLHEFPDLVGLVAGVDASLTVEHLVDSLLRTPSGASAVWNALSSGAVAWLTDAVLSSEARVTAVCRGLDPSLAIRASGAQAAMIVSYFTADPQRARQDLGLALAAAQNLDVRVQTAALSALEASGAVADAWLQVLETALPQGLAVGRRHLEQMRAETEIKAAVLACLDSAVEVVRTTGVGLLDERQWLLEDSEFWAALAESDEVAIQRMVAEEALVRSSVNPTGDFDRRVLVRRRQGRQAKKAIQHRLDSMSLEEIARPERLAALVNLSQGLNRQDREWAMTRLAVLALHGVDIPAVSVSRTTGGAA